jgi:hypothetical protein
MIFLPTGRKFNASIIETSISGYMYVQIIIIGLNFSFKRFWPYRARRLMLKIQYTKERVLYLPIHMIVLVFKRRVVLFGNKTILSGLIKEISAFRKPNIYTGKGLRLRNGKTRYKVKPGKVRRR